MTTSAPARAHVIAVPVPVDVRPIGKHSQAAQRAGMTYQVWYLGSLRKEYGLKDQAQACADGINLGVDIARAMAQRLVAAL